MPPNAELRPPRPGEPRPQETSTRRPGQGGAVADTGRRAMQRATARRRRRAPAMPRSRRWSPRRPSARRHRSQHPQPGQSGHRALTRQRQDLHRQPDLLAGQAAAGTIIDPDQGAAAPARRPGDRPAVDRADPPTIDAPQARPARRHLLTPALDRSAAGPARRPASRAPRSLPQAPAWRQAALRRSRGRPRPSPWPTACRSSCCRRAARRSSRRCVVYKVGSADEVFGRTGIAHFLEHMMFKGTATLAADRVLAHRRAQRRPRQRLHRLRRHRLPPDRRRRPARAGDAHGSRSHGEPAHPREGADARAPGRARGTPHAGRQRAASCSTRRCASSCSAGTSPTACRSVGYVDDVKRLSVDDLTAFYRRSTRPTTPC